MMRIRRDASLFLSALAGACGGTAQDPIDPPPSSVAITLTPAAVTLDPGQSQQFLATGSGGASLPGTPVFSAAGGGVISSSGLFTAGTDGGTYRVIAYVTVDGTAIADTSLATVELPPPPPSATISDPSALAEAAGQLKDVAAYTALNIRGLPAGAQYTDPVTGVRVWKVTSASVPTSNSFQSHFYSEGPAQVSREWAAGKSTLYLYSGWLVDFTRGVGLSNWRRVPSGTKMLTFSKNPATPRIAFVAVGSQLRRYDTGTNTYVDTGLFPATFNIETWLQQDKDDRWFVANGASSGTVIAWNSQTGQSLSRSVSGLDEPYLERDGRYVMLNGSSVQVWDLSTNTVAGFSAPGNTSVGHVPSLRGFFVLGDVQTGQGITPHWRADPSAARNHAQFTTLDGYAPDAHMSGMWVQTDAELGGDLTRQWFLRTSYNWSYSATGAGVKEGLALLTLDGQFRILLHHYSVVPTAGADNYWSEPRGTLSVDGKLVMFDSNMNNSPRVDVFLAEVPVR